MSSLAAAGTSAGPGRRASTPVTIITGFLGAGKTTLVNKILKQFVEDRNIAVIENEFGEVNLDSKMVSSKLRSKEDLVSIHSGCVCCSLRKDIVTALAELSRRAEQSNRRYDNIILETTGLADPAPVAFTFFANSWAKRRFHLDSIVTVVDAKYLDRHLASGASIADLKTVDATGMTTEQRARAAMAPVRAQHGGGCPTGGGASGPAPGESVPAATSPSTSPRDSPGSASSSPVNEVFNQIAFADVVLLNKVDLVSDDSAVMVERAIREINGLAKVVHTQLNDDDCPNWVSTILDGRKFSLERALEVDQQFLDSATSSEDENEDQDDPAATEGRGSKQPDSADASAAAAAAASRGSGGLPTGADAAADVAAAAATAGDGGAAAATAAAIPVLAADAAGAAAVPQAGSENVRPAATAAAPNLTVNCGRKPKRRATDMEQPDEGSPAEKKDNKEDKNGMEQWITRRPRKLLRTLHDLTSVRSVYLLVPGELDAYLFNMFMNDFLQERGTDIYRSKGTLCVHGHQRTFNFQGVHETFQLAPCTEEGFDIHNNPHSELVFIGRRLDKMDIKQGLLACLWRPLPPNWTEYLDKRTCRTYYVNSETGSKSWTRPVPETPEEVTQDAAAAAAAAAEGAERMYVSESCVKQPAAVRP